MIQTLTREELRLMLSRGKEVLLLEIGPQESYNRAHLPGAWQATADQIAEWAHDLDLSPSMEIVLYPEGRTPHDSALQAARHLETLGYQHLYYYPGGKDDWLSAGYSIESFSKAA
jgi:rhodanese-related sulfurtransferase